MKPEDEATFDSVFEDFFSQGWKSHDFNSTYAKRQTPLSSEDKQLLQVIKDEAAEYFNPLFHVDMKYRLHRMALHQTQRDRVVGFMKERLKWYNENGYLVK